MNWDEVRSILLRVYPSKDVEDILSALALIKPAEQPTPTNKSIINTALITYASSFISNSSTPLRALFDFMKKYRLDNYLDIVHILPFYPWDTDKGFSVVDFYEVKKEYGTWKDIEQLASKYRLMFDFVANHASIDNLFVQSSLIHKHLPDGDVRKASYAKFADFVITFNSNEIPSEADLKVLIRPRPTPVLTEYYVIEKTDTSLQAVLGNANSVTTDTKVLGGGYIWTTFSRPKNVDGSEDTRQVDLNYANSQVFLEALNILLFYVSKGASLIRLDAIGYLWKRLGSNSLHEPEVHLILEAMTKALKILVPDVVCIAEINEPQDKVIRYLGDEVHPEADVVYQFAHFPLAIYTVLKEDITYYSEWLKTTGNFKGKQFVTILGSHDGLGLKPAMGILSKEQIDELKGLLIDVNKGLPNYSLLPGGEKIVYEICGTPWNLINGVESYNKTKALAKYLAVVTLGLSIRGIPAFYINGLIGSQNYLPANGLDENRTVNREEHELSKIIELLYGEKSQEYSVLSNILKVLKIKNTEPAFSMDGDAPYVIDLKNTKVLCVKLVNKEHCVFIVVNCSGKTQHVDLNLITPELKCVDLLTGQNVSGSKCILDSYQSRILKPLETIG